MVELVHEYHLQPHGQKATWLINRGLTYHRLRRWRESLYEAELARLQARVDEREQTNAALGKAIGLLHARSELEPDTTPMTNDPDSSSTSKTHSSPS